MRRLRREQMQRHAAKATKSAKPALGATGASTAGSLPCVDALSLGPSSTCGSEWNAPTDRSSASYRPTDTNADTPSRSRASVDAVVDHGSSASSSPHADAAPHPLRDFMHRSREEAITEAVARVRETSDGAVAETKKLLSDALAAYCSVIPPGGVIASCAEDRPWRMKRRRLSASLTAIEKKELRALRNRERSMLLRTQAKRRLLALEAAASGLVDDNVGLENMLAVLLAVDTSLKLRARQHIFSRGLAQLQYVLV